MLNGGEQRSPLVPTVFRSTGAKRLYRQAPLNAIWEGSGNVICLDVLRALQTEPHAATALLAELAACRGQETRLDALADDLTSELHTAAAEEPAVLQGAHPTARSPVRTIQPGL